MPFVRARDLRTNIKDYGFENGIVVTIEQLLDEFAGYRLHMRELTDLCARCIDQIDQFTVLGEGMKAQIETIKRVREQDDNTG